MKHIIYLKPTERCNLKCLHCYNETGDTTTDFLATDRYTAFLKNYLKYIILNYDLSTFELEVVFHGGEPTIVGIEYLRNYAYLTQRILKDINLTFSIQTNLITEEIHKLTCFARKYTNGRIGTSFSPGLRFAGQDSKFKEIWERNLQILDECGIKTYCVITLSKKLGLTPEELLTVINDYKFEGFHFEPITNNGRASDNWNDIALSPQQYDKYKSEFAIEYIEEEHYKDYQYCEITRKARTFVDGKYVGCANRNCMKTVTTINANGTMSTCPNISKEVLISSIAWPLELFFDSEVRKDLIIQERAQSNECIACRHFGVCNGGCCQLSGCYEGKLFFDVLERYMNNDTKFRKHVEEYERR